MSIARAFPSQALENIGVRQRFSEVLLGMVKALGAGVSVMAVVQLAREGSGAVVVSESLKSNTLNILAGVCLPALLIGFAAPSPRIVFAAFWLVGVKVFALAAASHRHGLHRIGGAALVVRYLIFAVVVVLCK